jgi:predicted metal-dependent hydrolase
VQLRLPWARSTTRAAGHQIRVQGRVFPVEIVRRRGARRYVVRVASDSVVRITVPYGARIGAGLAFAERQADWIGTQWARQQARNAPWPPGTKTWFRGKRVRIDTANGRVRLGDEDAGAVSNAIDLKEPVLRHMRKVANGDLPARCLELSGAAGRAPTRVSVRNQRSRWGACSSRGTITLNWRLVQVPPSVRDYVIHHELAHLAVPNHSRAFWREVERRCQTWRESERWLKAHEGQFF